MPDNSGPFSTLLAEFRAQHQLPDAFVSTAQSHYVPLAEHLIALAASHETPLVGINGAQGTGKSTLANFLRLACRQTGGLNVVEFSIDDFYLTRDERAALGRAVHPLLRVRGLPGTHDLKLLSRCIADLKSAGKDDTVAVPVFDKADDDRAEPSDWQQVTGPVDLIILEGWCVGSRGQPATELGDPINDLERQEDPSGVCREHANLQLAGDYHQLFAQLDSLIFLAAPSFDAIVRWRSLQEKKLANSLDGSGKRLMNKEEIVRFVRLFERITRWNLQTLPNVADVVLQLNEAHQVVNRTRSGQTNDAI